MKYLQNIGQNAKRAFESLKRVEHKKIQEVLNEYNNLLRINKKKIIRENKKDIIKCKRKHLIDRLILDEKKIDGIRKIYK